MLLSCSQGSWRSKYRHHRWVECDSTGGVRQLTKCPTCSCTCCVHGVSPPRENSLSRIFNTNNNNNNNRLFHPNKFHIIQVTVPAWPLERSIDYNLRLRKMSPGILFLFIYVQIMRARRSDSLPHCQISGDSICPCRGPCRFQKNSLRQLEDMIRATSGATSPVS